jgi:hypothetical protein
MQPHLFNYCRFTSLELPQRLLHVDLNWVSVLTFFFQAWNIILDQPCHQRTPPPSSSASPQPIYIDASHSHGCSSISLASVWIPHITTSPPHLVLLVVGLGFLFIFFFLVAFIVFMFFFLYLICISVFSFCVLFLSLNHPCLLQNHMLKEILLLVFLLLNDKSCSVLCNASPINLLSVVVILT